MIYLCCMDGNLRYTCTCDPVASKILGDQYSYPRQIVVELPEWSYERKRRLRSVLSSTVCIDLCIVEAIKMLWAQGIETTGCCCGHNEMRAWVGVHPAWYEDMFILGYAQMPPCVTNGYVMGLYTFYL